MARFRGTLKGQRGQTSRLGSKNTGLTATIDGWDFGVKVFLYADKDDNDTAIIYLTGGSNNNGIKKNLGVFSLDNVLGEPSQ